MDIIGIILGQAGRPSGWFGRLAVRGMNRSHARLAQWGVGQVSLPRSGLLLDVGCGGGGTVGMLAKMAPEGRVFGIDTSEASVAVSRKANRPLIEAGRVAIIRGTVAALPYEDSGFDLVMTVQSHFFWPDPLSGAREIWRVLRPGGTLVIVSAVLRVEQQVMRRERWSELVQISYQRPDRVQGMLSSAGFVEIVVNEDAARNRMCAVGTKASPSR